LKDTTKNEKMEKIISHARGRVEDGGIRKRPLGNEKGRTEHAGSDNFKFVTVRKAKSRRS